MVIELPCSKLQTNPDGHLLPAGPVSVHHKEKRKMSHFIEENTNKRGDMSQPLTPQDRRALRALYLWLADNIGMESGLQFDNEGLVKSEQAMAAFEKITGTCWVRPGISVRTLKGEIDTDEDGQERTTPPGTWGYVSGHNHDDHWDVRFPKGAWVVLTEAELFDREQYHLREASGEFVPVDRKSVV